MAIYAPSKKRPLLRRYFLSPWSLAARNSPALRRYCAKRGYLTPHFSIAEMADTQTHELPRSMRSAARRHCFNLERLRHRLGGITLHIDGPYRTPSHNRQVGGATLSRHMHGDATDHFITTVDGWVKASPNVTSRNEVVKIAEEIFPGVGNETSGTLHLDSRPGRWARFVTW